MTVCSFLFAVLWAQATPAEIIKEIEAVQEPPLGATDDESIAKWEKSCDEVAIKKGELILKLVTAYPEHAETPKYLDLRWDGYTGHRTPCDLARLDRLDADLNAFLAKPQLPKNLEVAHFWVGRSKIIRYWRTMRDQKLKSTDADAKSYLDGALATADGVQKQHPKYENGAFLYYQVSQMGKGSKMEITALEQIARKYPNHRIAPAAKGRAKILGMLDKPFRLRFTDVKTGKTIDIKDYRGKVVLIDFWATWCGPCRLDIEEQMLKKVDEWKQRGLEIIGISADVPEDKGGKKMLLDYINEKNIPWPNYYDGKGQSDGFAADCGVLSFPTQFLVDREGLLRSIEMKGRREALIEQYLGSGS